MAATGYTTDPAAVDSVNGHTGAVELGAADVDAVATAATVTGADTLTVNRPATGAEGADVWQVQYAGQRGMYANGYACARARVPAHADAAEQYAFRAQCHPSKNGTAQPIGSFALSDNTDMFVTQANGDSYATRDLYAGGRKVSAPAVGVALTALNSFSSPPATPAMGRLVNASKTVELGGRIANQTAGTLTAGTVMCQLPADLRPSVQIKLGVRYSGGGNALTIETTGDVSIGTNITAGQEVFLDGLSFVRDWT